MHKQSTCYFPKKKDISQSISDLVTWVYEKTKIFSTASMCKELMFPDLINRWLIGVWDAPLPKKIKIFLWQVYNDKIQSADQFRKRNWPGEISYKGLRSG